MTSRLDANDSAVVHNVTAFVRGLRALGFSVAPAEEVLAVRALSILPLGDAEAIYAGLRAILVKERDTEPLFRLAWQQYLLMLVGVRDPWLARQTLLANVAKKRMTQRLHPEVIWRGRAEGDALKEDSSSPWRLGHAAMATADERLAGGDVPRLILAERAEIDHLIRSARPLYRRSGKREQSRAGAELDLRSMLRQRARTGEWLPLSRMRRIKRARPTVIAIDVSGSMNPFSRVLVRFAYALTQAIPHVETYLFSTRLTRVTTFLRAREPDLALAEAYRCARDFAGGTRLADALRELRQVHGARALQPSAHFLLASDGLDAGDAEDWVRELRFANARVHRFYWLNPYASSLNYEPSARAMSTAVEVCDAVLPAGNWAELESSWRQIARFHF